MIPFRIAGMLLLTLAAGCACTQRAPDAAPPKAGVTPERAPEPSQPVPPPKQDKTTVAANPPQPAPQPETPAVAAPAAPPVAVVAAPSRPEAPVVKPEAPVVKPEAPVTKPEAPVVKPEAPAAKPAAKAPAVPAPKKEVTAPPAPKPAPLDLASLEKRLKDTNAIGVFTKLTLKNQVDDLVNQFRAYYQGKSKTTLAALRQPYDQLLLKVLALLQEGDPMLARAIAESREAIWGILSDPDKFKNL